MQQKMMEYINVLVLVLQIITSILIIVVLARGSRAGFGGVTYSPGASKVSVFDGANQGIGAAGFFPGAGVAPDVSYPPDREYLNKYLYNGAASLPENSRTAALQPILARLNAPGTSGYPYPSKEEISQHLINDQVMAASLGAVQCANGTWVVSKDQCGVPSLDKYKVEGMGGFNDHDLISRI